MRRRSSAPASTSAVTVPTPSFTHSAAIAPAAVPAPAAAPTKTAAKKRAASGPPAPPSASASPAAPNPKVTKRSKTAAGTALQVASNAGAFTTVCNSVAREHLTQLAPQVGNLTQQGAQTQVQVLRLQGELRDLQSQNAPAFIPMAQSQVQY
ncbi:hypothetical protein OC835_007204 [Tilletia horrida]|nr:hypothetical protein OC835_007204 [Tilletia horrida]